MFRCIYCGTQIQGGAGLSCAKCTSKEAAHKTYDKELGYDASVESRLPELMESVENGPIAERSSPEAKDALDELTELNTHAREKYKFENQDELSTKRTGRVLHMNDFMAGLRRAGLNAWYTDKGGMAGTLGLFIMHDGLKPQCKHNQGAPHYVCYVQVPFMQEYEELHFDRYGVPLNSKRRGWRTVLLNLILQKVLTEQKAHEIFGEPETGPISRRYRQQLKYFRTL